MEMGEGKDIMEYVFLNFVVKFKDFKYRFNWNVFIIVFFYDFSIIYYVGNVVFKMLNGGMDWEVISFDFIRNDIMK